MKMKALIALIVGLKMVAAGANLTPTSQNSADSLPAPYKLGEEDHKRERQKKCQNTIAWIIFGDSSCEGEDFDPDYSGDTPVESGEDSQEESEAPKEDGENDKDDADDFRGGVGGGGRSFFEDLFARLGFKNRKNLSPYNLDNLHQGTKELVITIDDGPTPGVTDKILDNLLKYDAQAVFFVIGEKAKRHPELLARMQREGHIVANHTMTHPKIGSFGVFTRKKKVKEEILGAHEVVKNYATNSPHYYFRAPYGSWQKAAAKIINKEDVGAKYIGPLLWDIGGVMDAENLTQAADWACWSKNLTVEQCFTGYKNDTLRREGGVILFHDLKKESAELIGKMLKEFSENPEYRFISIDEVDIP